MTAREIQSNGFTLLEMLFVLSLLSIVILLSFPIQHSALTKEKEKRFFEMLQYDVLYIQNKAMTTDDWVNIRFTGDQYVIFLGNGKVLYRRVIPESWLVHMSMSMQRISFTGTGTIRQPGTVTFRTPSATYKLICPLGKGRCYVEQ